MEAKKKIKMYMGIPSTGDRADFQVYMLRELEERYGEQIEFVYPRKCIHRMFHDFARNAVVEEFLETDCDVLWFLDSDIVPAKHCLDLITMHWDTWKLAGCPYPVFMPVPGEEVNQLVFTVYKGKNGIGMHACRIPYEGVEFVDGIATGCLFIKREILENMKKPYFAFKYDPEDQGVLGGEDIGFCLKMQSLGHKFLVDYSMVCKHYKKVDLLDVNNYAMSYTNKAVLAYDQQIRGQIEALSNKIESRKTEARIVKPQSGLIIPGR